MPLWSRLNKNIVCVCQILFLDVLFPLDVDRIIFIDADLVVRADLQLLMDYDLGRAPYGCATFFYKTMQKSQCTYPHMCVFICL